MGRTIFILRTPRTAVAAAYDPFYVFTRIIHRARYLYERVRVVNELSIEFCSNYARLSPLLVAELQFDFQHKSVQFDLNFTFCSFN